MARYYYHILEHLTESEFYEVKSILSDHRTIHKFLWFKTVVEPDGAVTRKISEDMNLKWITVDRVKNSNNLKEYISLGKVKNYVRRGVQYHPPSGIEGVDFRFPRG